MDNKELNEAEVNGNNTNVIGKRPEIKNYLEMDPSEIIKKSLTLLGFLLLFCIFSIPSYFLMTAGAKDVTNEVTVEKSVKDGPEDTEGRNIFGSGAGNVETDPFAQNPFGDVNGTQQGEEVSEDGNYYSDGYTNPGYADYGYTDYQNTIPGMSYGEPAGTEITPEMRAMMKFRLNGFAFFGGMILVILLYVIYFEAVLKKRFRTLMQTDRTALVASLVAFLLFMLVQFVAIALIPNRITKGLSTFTGIPWELAYLILVFFVFFTLIGTWLDANLNRVVYIDNVPFHYTQFGNGAKNLILIAGLNTMTLEGQGLNLAWTYREFAKDYTVYIMDKKDEVKENVTLRELAEDIADVIDHIGLVSVNVIGVSQGGMIAQYLTIDNPELVDKLVLAVTASKMNDSIKNYVNQCVVYAQKGVMGEVLRDSFEKDFTPEYTKSIKPFLPLLAKISVPKSNVRFIRLARAINSLDTYDELDKIKCPVFVIGAGKDRIVTVDASNEIAEKLGCKKYIYQRLGHGVYSEAKDFNERILRFLK